MLAHLVSMIPPPTLRLLNGADRCYIEHHANSDGTMDLPPVHNLFDDHGTARTVAFESLDDLVERLLQAEVASIVDRAAQMFPLNAPYAISGPFVETSRSHVIKDDNILVLRVDGMLRGVHTLIEEYVKMIDGIKYVGKKNPICTMSHISGCIQQVVTHYQIHVTPDTRLRGQEGSVQ